MTTDLYSPAFDLRPYDGSVLQARDHAHAARFAAVQALHDFGQCVDRLPHELDDRISSDAYEARGEAA